VSAIDPCTPAQFGDKALREAFPEQLMGLAKSVYRSCEWLVLTSHPCTAFKVQCGIVQHWYATFSLNYVVGDQEPGEKLRNGAVHPPLRIGISTNRWGKILLEQDVKCTVGVKQWLDRVQNFPRKTEKCSALYWHWKVELTGVEKRLKKRDDRCPSVLYELASQEAEAAATDGGEVVTTPVEFSCPQQAQPGDPTMDANCLGMDATLMHLKQTQQRKQETGSRMARVAAKVDALADNHGGNAEAPDEAPTADVCNCEVHSIVQKVPAEASEWATCFTCHRPIQFMDSLRKACRCVRPEHACNGQFCSTCGNLLRIDDRMRLVPRAQPQQQPCPSWRHGGGRGKGLGTDRMARARLQIDEARQHANSLRNQQMARPVQRPVECLKAQEDRGALHARYGYIPGQAGQHSGVPHGRSGEGQHTGKKRQHIQISGEGGQCRGQAGQHSGGQHGRSGEGQQSGQRQDNQISGSSSPGGGRRWDGRSDPAAGGQRQ